MKAEVGASALCFLLPRKRVPIRRPGFEAPASVRRSGVSRLSFSVSRASSAGSELANLQPALKANQVFFFFFFPPLSPS